MAAVTAALEGWTKSRSSGFRGKAWTDLSHEEPSAEGPWFVGFLQDQYQEQLELARRTEEGKRVVKSLGRRSGPLARLYRRGSEPSLIAKMSGRRPLRQVTRGSTTGLALNLKIQPNCQLTSKPLAPTVEASPSRSPQAA